MLAAVNYVKNYHDPTVANIPLLAPNGPEPLFHDLRDFRFADGACFDWAGLKRRSFHHRGRTLSVTNQRAWKGFAVSFSFRRTYHGLFGEWKIDWQLVKQFPPSPGIGEADRELLPYYGRTLCDLNTATPDRISDHCPTTLEFPLR